MSTPDESAPTSSNNPTNASPSAAPAHANAYTGSRFSSRTGPDPLIRTTVAGWYRMLQSIGEGGFGVVYAAGQTAPVRPCVALKVLKPGMDSKSIQAGFQAERHALGVMDHPCIATVLDAG